MPVSLGTSGQASFDEPLELLKDCHRRIESFLDMLLRVVEQSPDGALNDERRRALEAALRYFKEAAPRHTQDEEESLFPRLRQCGQEEVHAALDQVQALEADHVHANQLHDLVDATGMQWLQDGRLPADARATLRTQLEALRELYRKHIQVEDSEIFPLAGRTLPAAELAAVGREMKARRKPGASGPSCTQKNV